MQWNLKINSKKIPLIKVRKIVLIASNLKSVNDGDGPFPRINQQIYRRTQQILKIILINNNFKKL